MATTTQPQKEGPLIEWRSHGVTDVGCVRKVNEDSLLDKPVASLWAVADGMGGHQYGDYASQKLVERLSAIDLNESLADCVDAIENCLLDVNQDLLSYAQAQASNHIVGTTIVVMFIQGNVGVCLWVGDSRLYRMRAGQLQQLTRDHSQVEEMLRLGLITAEDAKTHPNRNVITRAIGADPDLHVDINVFSLNSDDTYMLCSDGLYNVVAASDIKQSLYLPAKNGCSNLIKLALDNNADDNVSVIVVKGKSEF